MHISYDEIWSLLSTFQISFAPLLYSSLYPPSMLMIWQLTMLISTGLVLIHWLYYYLMIHTTTSTTSLDELGKNKYDISDTDAEEEEAISDSWFHVINWRTILSYSIFLAFCVITLAVSSTAAFLTTSQHVISFSHVNIGNTLVTVPNQITMLVYVLQVLLSF